MATEWATSQSVTVTIPSADSDDTFNAALDALAAKARRASPDPDGADSRRIVAIEIDLINALRNTRAQAMHSGEDNGYAIDRVLLKVIWNYSAQIGAGWA